MDGDSDGDGDGEEDGSDGRRRGEKYKQQMNHGESSILVAHRPLGLIFQKYPKSLRMSGGFPVF